MDSRAKVWSYYKEFEITKIVKDGGYIPKFYGFYRHDYERDIRIYLPFPINIFLALGRRIWIFLRWDIGGLVTGRDSYGSFMYRLGYRTGVEEGYKFGRDFNGHVEAEFNKGLKGGPPNEYERFCE